MLIDTHAHLYWDSYREDLDAVVQRTLDANVKTIINVGVDLESSQKALEQIGQLAGLTVYSTAGIHPHEALRFASPSQGKPADVDESIHRDIEGVEKLCKENPGKVVAVGECGLDFFFREGPEFNPTSLSQDEIKELQIKLFRAQVNLAKELNLPVIIHCREGWDKIWIPELAGSKGLFHNFTGSPEDLKKALDLGYYLSFSCIITYPKNENLREILRDLPLNKILTETDCPFLPPQRIRGQRNEPANIAEIIKVISEIKQLPENQVAERIFQNAKELFSLT